jgi:serine protease
VYLGNLEPRPLQYAADRVVVGFDPSVDDGEASLIARVAGASIERSALGRAFRVLSVPRGRVWQTIDELKRHPNVRYAHPDWIAHAAQVVPNDPLYPYQWHFENPVYGGIHMEEAWANNNGGDPSVVVAVLDTGIAYENFGAYCKSPDLAGTTFVPGWDFINGDSHPNDDNSHGTHVAGTIAQTTNNGVGVAGIAHKTSLMPVKVLNNSGSGSISQIADGIRFAVDNGADVINMSLSTSASPVFLTVLEDAVKYAHQMGVLLVAASGNSSASSPGYPAGYAEVIAVGATKYNNGLASYSNRGNEVCAPGGENENLNGDPYPDMVLQSTLNPNTRQACDLGYWFFQGTSMASPHVAGVAALMLSENPGLTSADVRQILQDTANNAVDLACGFGLIDAAAALDAASSGDAPPTVSIASPQNGDVVSGTETIQIAAADDSMLVSVEWSVDGGPWSPATPSGGSYVASWNTTTSIEDSIVVLRARATDDASQTTVSAPVSVKVNNDNAPPLAAFTFTCGGSTCDFDASTSSDSDGTIASYSWNFGDGTMGSGPTLGHTFASPGTYSVSLTVTDDLGATGSTSKNVVIEEVTSTMHVSDLDGTSRNRRLGIWQAFVTITVRDSGGSLVNGAAVSGQFSDGPSLFQCTTGGSGSCTVNGFQWFQTCLTFTVTNVSHQTLTYRPEENQDPDGDSDGTSLTVCRP